MIITRDAEIDEYQIIEPMFSSWSDELLANNPEIYNSRGGKPSLSKDEYEWYFNKKDIKFGVCTVNNVPEGVIIGILAKNMNSHTLVKRHSVVSLKHLWINNHKNEDEILRSMIHYITDWAKENEVSYLSCAIPKISNIIKHIDKIGFKDELTEYSLLF